MYVFAWFKKDLDDIDLIARGAAWEKAKSLGEVIIPDSQIGKVVQLFDKSIEIFNEWTPGKWNIDELIDTAERVDGIPYVTLENVVMWKKRMGRSKDLEHVKLIEIFLVKNVGWNQVTSVVVIKQNMIG